MKVLESDWVGPALVCTYHDHYHRPTAAAVVAVDYAVDSFVVLLVHRNGMEQQHQAVDHPCHPGLDSVSPVGYGMSILVLLHSQS